METVSPEIIAYWFFRLNGCATITNFVVHPDRRAPSQRTDVDVLAVRFPHRAELLTSGEPMQDHKVFQASDKIEIVLAEVKHGMCRLNGPWTNPSDENMHRVLYAVGAFPHEQVPAVAQALYEDGAYNDAFYRVRLFAVGATKNNHLLPDAVQLTWDEVLRFIYRRFDRYRDQKAHHTQWDQAGRMLFNYSCRNTEDEFVEMVQAGMRRHVERHNVPREDRQRGET